MTTFFNLKQWVAVVLSTAGIFAAHLHAQTNPPREWIDADTGHRVVQLSTEPGSESLYFNLNPFTPDGQKMVITSPDGISLVNLQTHEVEKVTGGRARIIMVGRKTGQRGQPIEWFIFHLTRQFGFEKRFPYHKGVVTV